MDYLLLKENLIDFLQSNLNKTACKSFILGVSGGLDSAVVATLCALSGIKTYAYILPSNNSSKNHLEDGINLCKKLEVEYKIISIAGIIQEFERNLAPISALRLGNLCARIRMATLYDASAMLGGVVVGTSNLSERVLGYGTIYGDLGCAFNPLGEILKSEIFEFARYLKIDENIINKAPSADLWEGQSDEKELGYSYKELDGVIFALYIKKIATKIVKERFGEEIVNFVVDRMKKNAFKLAMPPIANTLKLRNLGD